MSTAVKVRYEDRRNAKRHHVLLHAMVVIRDRTTYCIVRDLSDTGAKLGVSACANLPDRFDLRFVGNAHEVPVRLMWRSGNAAGVRFEAPHQASSVISRIPKHLNARGGRGT